MQNRPWDWTLVLAALAPLPAVAQQPVDWAAVEITPVKLTDGLYVLTGRGGNIGLSIGPDGGFSLAHQSPPLPHRFRAPIRTLTPQPVKFILNTHWHGDHTGGNENMGKAGALIAATPTSGRHRKSTRLYS